MLKALKIREGEITYTTMLFFAGAALILSGACAIESGWLLCWLGAGFILVGLAYVRFGEGVFGKRIDGGRRWINRIALCLFLMLNYLLWHLRHRFLSKEDCCNEVSPGIWLGRRPLDSELPAAVTTVVDATAEFSAGAKARKLNYMCIPTLDGCAPNSDEFDQLMRRLSLTKEPVYIHCAAGHGRSAAVAVALLVVRGLANDLDGAESIVRSKRPRISIKRAQKELLQRWFESWTAANSAA